MERCLLDTAIGFCDDRFDLLCLQMFSRSVAIVTSVREAERKEASFLF
jgi:hypothetical protein